MTVDLEHETQIENHHVANRRDIRINRVLWLVMVCSLVASLTIIAVQLGIIKVLLAQLDEPPAPLPAVRVHLSTGQTMICALTDYNKNEAPLYVCTIETQR